MCSPVKIIKLYRSVVLIKGFGFPLRFVGAEARLGGAGFHNMSVSSQGVSLSEMKGLNQDDF